MNKIILTLMAASLLCVGLTACGGEASLNNPLNVEAPAWQQFVHPKGDNVIVYKKADVNSPHLQFAAEPCDGDACDFKILWSDEKAPRGWDINEETANSYSAYPILAEEGDFYKVYYSREWLGAVEGYIKKEECNVVKPSVLTQELIDSIGNLEFRRDYLVQEGDLKNLCLSSYLGEYDETMFDMGQLCGNCLVYVKTKPIMLQPSSEKASIQFSRNENDENESYLIAFGNDQLWQPNESSPSVFDTRKLNEEQVRNIYNSIKIDIAKPTMVLYYLPDVSKERLMPFYIYLTGDDLRAARICAVFDLKSPKEITSTPGCPFNEIDTLGFWNCLSGGEGLVFILYKKGYNYYDVEFDAYNKTFREPHSLQKGTTHGMEMFKCEEERQYYQIREKGGLAIRDMGNPEFVIDNMAHMEWKN